MWIKAAVACACCSSNSGGFQSMSVCVGLVHCFVVVASGSLNYGHASWTVHLTMDTYLLRVFGYLQVTFVGLVRCYKSQPFAQGNIVICPPRMEVLSLKISINDKTSYEPPPDCSENGPSKYLGCSLIRFCFPTRRQVDPRLRASWTKYCQLTCRWLTTCFVAKPMPFPVFQSSPLPTYSHELSVTILKLMRQSQGCIQRLTGTMWGNVLLVILRSLP
jgi:hypothetical protein